MRRRRRSFVYLSDSGPSAGPSSGDGLLFSSNNNFFLKLVTNDFLLLSA